MVHLYEGSKSKQLTRIQELTIIEKLGICGTLTVL